LSLLILRDLLSLQY